MTGVRELKKAERRREILVAAAEAFTEMGFRGATIAGIAERMGTAKSAVGYHHFASKHEIAVEIVEHTRSRWREFIDQATAAPASGLGKLLTLLLSAALDARQNVLAAAAVRLAADQRVNGFDLPAAGFSWRGVAHDLVWESLEAGELPAGSRVDEVVSLIITGSYGVFVSESQGFEEIRTEAHLREVWRRILPALGVADHDALIDGIRPLDVPDPWLDRTTPGDEHPS